MSDDVKRLEADDPINAALVEYQMAFVKLQAAPIEPFDTMLRLCWEQSFDGWLDYRIRQDVAPPNLRLTVSIRRRARDVLMKDSEWKSLDVTPTILQELFARLTPETDTETKRDDIREIDATAPPEPIPPEVQALTAVKQRAREAAALAENLRLSKDQLGLAALVPGFDWALSAMAELERALAALGETAENGGGLQ